MKTVRVVMEEAHYERLRAQAKQMGLPGVASVLLGAVNALSDASVGADIVKQAVAKAKRHPIGEAFIVKKLFEKSVWDSFPKVARLNAGKQFTAYIKDHDCGIVRIGPTSANHMQYVRIK